MEDLIDYMYQQPNFKDRLVNIKNILITFTVLSNQYPSHYKKYTTIKGLKSQLNYSNTITYLKEISLNGIISWEIVTKDLNDYEIEYIKGR